LSQFCVKQPSASSEFIPKSYMTFGSKDESHIFNYSIFYLLWKLRCKTLNLHRKMENSWVCSDLDHSYSKSWSFRTSATLRLC